MKPALTLSIQQSFSKGASLGRSMFHVGCSMLFVCLLTLTVSAAQSTNSAPALAAPVLPDMGLSLLRVMGALALVLAIFLGGVWLFRNWQRLVIQRGRAPQLNVLEVRSLGGRHALYVVGFERERFLIASSPSGVNLVSHLESSGDETAGAIAPSPGSFAQNLTQMLKGK